MALQYQTTLRNNQLDQIGTSVGASGVLDIFTGAAPANCAAADTGTKLVEITLPATPFAAASAGSKAKSGTWSAAASASGTAGYFRIKDGSGNVIVQGTVGQGSGDMSLDNTNIATGQTVTVNSFSISAGNA